MSLGYQALRSGAAWLDLSARGRIVARGRDRARLLHAITTNEVKKMTPGTGCYAFLLNPQGRIQADLCLFCLDDHFLIDTEPELREKVRLHIKRYIIADQVELEDVTARTAAIGLEGPGAAAILAALGAPSPEAPYTRGAKLGRRSGRGGHARGRRGSSSARLGGLARPYQRAGKDGVGGLLDSHAGCCLWRRDNPCGYALELHARNHQHRGAASQARRGARPDAVPNPGQNLGGLGSLGRRGARQLRRAAGPSWRGDSWLQVLSHPLRNRRL